MEIIITPQYADLLTIDLSPCKQFLSHHLELFSVLEQQLPLYQHDLKVFLENVQRDFRMTEFSTTCDQFITQELEKPFFKVTHERRDSSGVFDLINNDVETSSHYLKKEYNFIQQELNNRYFYLQELYNRFWNNQDPTYDTIVIFTRGVLFNLRALDVLMTKLQSFNVEASATLNRYKDQVASLHVSKANFVPRSSLRVRVREEINEIREQIQLLERRMQTNVNWFILIVVSQILFLIIIVVIVISRWK